MTVSWLIDKSAYVRLGSSAELLQLWLERINRGLVYVSNLTLLELGFSARNDVDWSTALRTPPVANLMVEYLTPAMEDRAIEVQGLLATHGHHRAPSVPDLLIAAVAELTGMTVLHVDKGFDLIAAVTHQSVERLGDKVPDQGPT